MSHNFIIRTYLKNDKPLVYKQRDADACRPSTSRQYKYHQTHQPLSIPSNLKLLGLGLGILALLWGFRPELERWIPWEGVSLEGVSLPTGLDFHQMREQASANRADKQEQRIEDIVEQLSETTTPAPQGSLVRIPIYEPSQGLNGYLDCQATNGYLSCQGRLQSF